MSQQQNVPKPSLQGVRIKPRKGAVKAQAKQEPTVFRDQLYKYIDTVPKDDFEAYTNKLVQAGSALEFLKYADQLFEILLVGGLLQPGGGYVDDGAPSSPFSILQAKEPAEVEDLKKYIDVLNKLIRRYKYLQKPLQETSLPGLLQYANRWPQPQREKIGVVIGLLLSQGIVTASVLLSLTKEHLVKNGILSYDNLLGAFANTVMKDISLNMISIIFRTYLADQPMDHLAGALKKGGIKDLLTFFPPQKQSPQVLEAYFKAENLPQVAEWYTKRQNAAIRDGLVVGLKQRCEQDQPLDEASTVQVIEFIKSEQAERPLPEMELLQCIWQGLMTSIDLSARPDQIEAFVLKEVTKYAPIIEPFCQGPKAEVALINVVQAHCYDDTRVIKTFSQILKVLYNKDCVSDQAIIYWYQKGAKAQGKQHFLKAAEPLVKYLQEQEDEESGEEEGDREGDGEGKEEKS